MKDTSVASWRPWAYVLLLSLAYMISFIDRQILSLLVTPIRAAFSISDTQFGLLHGLAFSLFYAVFGFPLGWLVDRVNRIRLVAAGILLWSAATAACGLAESYHQLFAARIGVGVGEAVLSPAAYSLFYDLFDGKRRGRAVSVYSLGITIGSGLAYTLGGAVIAAMSRRGDVSVPLVGVSHWWQASIMAVSIPGIVLGLLFIFLLREPTRKRRAASGTGAEGSRSPVRVEWALLLAHGVGFGLIALASVANSVWFPAFLIRSHGFSPAQAGWLLGTIYLFGGTLGLIGAGWTSDKLFSSGVTAAPVNIMIAVAPIAAVTCALTYFNGSLAALAVGAAAVVTIASMSSVLGPTSLQMIMPPNRIGRLSALYVFILTVLAQSGGPTAVALFSDKVLHDESKIGQALGTVSIVALLAGTGVLLAIRPRFKRVALGLA